MRKLMAIVAGAMLLIAVSGCELVDAVFDTSSLSVLDEVRVQGKDIEDKVLDSAADAADKYCITPRFVRSWFRDEINTRTETATVVVLCGDETL